jgi:hypothetical protein
VNLVRKEDRRGPKTWPKGTNRDSSLMESLAESFPGSIATQPTTLKSQLASSQLQLATDASGQSSNRQY